jgi:hypothetical protein
MRYLLRTIAISLIVLMGFTACEKEEALKPDLTAQPLVSSNGSSTMSMTAKVDGSAWAAKTASGAIVNGTINLTGTATDGSVITITVIGEEKGTYDLLTGGNAVYQVSLNESYNAGFTGGSLTISQINTSSKTFSGSFNFVGEISTLDTNDKRTRTITSGVFSNVSYINSVGGGSSSNTLQASVDGLPFVPASVAGSLLLSTNQIAISATDSQADETIGFFMPDDIVPGTYSFSGISGSYVGQYNRTLTEAFVAEEGELVISKHDKVAKRVEGTFYFLAVDLLLTDSVEVASGRFSTSYY